MIDITGSVMDVIILCDCNEHLPAETELPINERRRWDTNGGAKRSLTIPAKWKKSKKT
jgi:hypothetical protein